MPIVDIEPVLPDGAALPTALTPALADATGRVFASAPGRTWVRLRALPASAYAENETKMLDSDALPVFVTVLHAQPPQGEALAAQVLALTLAVAAVFGCDASRVHVQIAPAAVGRQAFGGRLVT